MAGYQSLTFYNGSMYGNPTYSGLEYDYEVPDNTVVSSPGGASTTHHYFNKGFYGDLSSTPDIYAGEGYYYPQGILGNAYQYGYDAATQQKIFDVPPDQMFTQNNSTPTIKEAFELIPPPETSPEKENFTNVADSLRRRLRIKVNPWLLFGFFILAYLAIDLFSYSFTDFLSKNVYGGKSLSWKNYLFFAVIFFILLIIFTKLAGVSIIEFESL